MENAGPVWLFMCTRNVDVRIKFSVQFQGVREKHVLSNNTKTHTHTDIQKIKGK